MKNILLEMFDKPRIIGIIADTNQGKSNLLYFMLTEVLKEYTYDLYTYGLRCEIGGHSIHSITEMENITDSVIIIDEFYSLFDLDDRKSRRSIENTLRLINHQNNIIILCGLPDNFKKFISSKLDIVIYKKCELAGFINGSRAKAIALQYRGDELGSHMLALPVNEALIFDSKYTKIKIPYMEKYDTKAQNPSIVNKCASKFSTKKCAENVPKNVEHTLQEVQ